MILYVNGDSNSDGSELKDPATSSWAKLLADRLGFSLVNEAKGGTSNPRIMRVASHTLSYLSKPFVVIGWTSWEREEWLYNGQYYDVNSGGHDTLPLELEERYKVWVTEQGPTQQSLKSRDMHEQIHRLHRSLLDRRIPHVFFNALMPFQHNLLDPVHKEWNNNYFGPYDNDSSYFWYLKKRGFRHTDNFHYTESAQEAWADLLYNYIIGARLV